MELKKTFLAAAALGLMAVGSAEVAFAKPAKSTTKTHTGGESCTCASEKGCVDGKTTEKAQCGSNKCGTDMDHTKS